LKVFIWNDPQEVWRGGSCLIVYANSGTEAREKALSARMVYPSGKEISIADLGPPDAIIDTSGAIYYEWSASTWL
jgi:hypothetical protein